MVLAGAALAQEVKPAQRVLVQDGRIDVMAGGKLALSYHTADVPPPPGVKKVFRKSAFIHPLNTPSGGTMTGIHPDDHYHHTGIWHAWVKTKHGLDEPDFWNLSAHKGRVRFSKYREIIDTPRVAGFEVAQEQIAYKGKESTETVVLAETLRVEVRQQGSLNIVDYLVTQKNVSGVALELPAYRYGGPLAYRGPLNWNKENSEYLTSEGKTRADSHTTRANWCAVFGPTDQGEGTLLFLGSPQNYDAPQRLRTWPEGKMFLNWAAVQEKGMTMQAGDTHVFSYRLITADRKLSTAEADALYDAWAKK